MNIYEIRALLIGLLFLAIMLWFIIKIHNYFSKNNIPILVSTLAPSTLSSTPITR
jgi:hypothetical protein